MDIKNHSDQSLKDLLSTPLEGRLLRANELSFRLGVSIPTLYHWGEIGHFPKRIQIGGHAVAWKGTEVKKWLDSLSYVEDQ